MQERFDGKTPSGGEYSIINYFDDSGNAVDKNQATKCVIREFDAQDNMIFETFGEIGKRR